MYRHYYIGISTIVVAEHCTYCAYTSTYTPTLVLKRQTVYLFETSVGVHC